MNWLDDKHAYAMWEIIAKNAPFKNNRNRTKYLYKLDNFGNFYYKVILIPHTSYLVEE